jgi:hypothetical protein
MLVIPDTWAVEIGRIAVWGWPLAKALDPIWKVTEAKKAESVAQVVACLPRKCEAPNSNSSTAKKESKKEKKEYPEECLQTWNTPNSHQQKIGEMSYATVIHQNVTLQWKGDAPTELMNSKFKKRQS